MARKEFGQHKKQTIIADDPAYDVGSDEWNGDAHAQDGVLGFDEPSETLLVAGVCTPTDSHTMINVGAESGTSDDLDTITATDYAENDIIIVKSTAGDTITMTTNGNITLVGNIEKRLSGGRFTYLQYNGTTWREIISDDTLFFDNTALKVTPY